MSTDNTNPFDVVSMNGKELVADADLQPLDWSQFAKAAMLAGTPIDAKDLVGSTFDILRARPFESAFDGQDHAIFCIVKLVEGGDVYQTTLGGQAVVSILDAYIEKGIKNPLRVTLDYVKGGKYNGYYQFK